MVIEVTAPTHTIKRVTVATPCSLLSEEHNTFHVIETRCVVVVIRDLIATAIFIIDVADQLFNGTADTVHLDAELMEYVHDVEVIGVITTLLLKVTESKHGISEVYAFNVGVNTVYVDGHGFGVVESDVHVVHNNTFSSWGVVL